MDKFWVDSPQSNNGSGYDRGQGYSGLQLDDDEYGLGKKKTARDPMSHRIIEKRRRDRMNNCLADLSRLLPASYMKKGRGRIEKTEIIEMAIRHLRHLQAHGACQQLDKCDIAAYLDQLYKSSDQYKKGYNDCMTETVRFMSQAENLNAPEATCTSLMNHLRQHCEKIMRDSNGNEASSLPASESDASTTRSAHTRSTSSSEGPQSSSTGDSGDSRRGSGSEDSPMPPDKGSISPNTDFETFCRPDTKSHLTERRLPEENGNYQRRPQEEMLGYSRREKDGHLETPLTPRRLDGRHTPPTSPSCSSASEYGNNGSYKFKNNIKQRFVADVAGEIDHRSMSPRGSKDMEGSEVKRPRLHVEESCPGSNQMWQPKQEPDRPPIYPRMASKASVKHYDYPLSRPGSAEIAQLPDQHPWQRYEPSYELESLPIFALHPKGTFYVPMSIELALIEPLLPDLAQCASLLHQVSISVNFSMPAKCISMRGLAPPREPVKRSLSSISQEIYPEQNRGLISHMEPPQTRPWEDIEEREAVRFPPGMKNRYDSGSSGRSDESVLRRNARVEPPSVTDPARWSLLMANARRS